MKRIALLGLMLIAPIVGAQTLSVTLTSNVERVVSPGTATLTWSAPGAVSCTASGGWTGSKPASGTQTISDLRATTSFALNCTGSTPTTTGSAQLSWTPPTRNTDGSTLTNLAGYRIYHSQNQATIGSATAITINNAATTAHTVPNLAAGTWYFGITAYTSAGMESNLSNVATKTITPGVAPTGSASVSVAVDTRPNAPTLVVVESTAYNLRLDCSNFFSCLLARLRDDYRLDRVVGTVPLGTACSKTSVDIREPGYARVPRESIAPYPRRSEQYVAKCELQMELEAA
jgi:hypothetical protein